MAEPATLPVLRPAVVDDRARAQQHRQRQHGHEAEGADAHIGMAPADGVDGRLEDRGPDGAGEIIAARHDGDRDAPLTAEPERDVGDQRAEGDGAPEHADEERLGQDELPIGAGNGGDKKSDGEHDRAEDERKPDAEAIGHASHQHAADGKAHHGRGIGKRGPAPPDAELGLDGRQDDDRRPQADAADGAERQRGPQPPPGMAAVGRERRPRQDRYGQGGLPPGGLIFEPCL